MGAGTRQVDKMKFVEGLAPIVPSMSTPDYVNLKNYNHLTIVIDASNAVTVTGSAITLKQATTVAGAGEKPLSFTKAWRNVDTAASDLLAEFAVASDAFTADATNSKKLMYVIEVDANDLDLDNGFDCLRLGTGNAVAQTVNALYILSGCRYSGSVDSLPSAIVD